MEARLVAAIAEIDLQGGEPRTPDGGKWNGVQQGQGIVHEEKPFRSFTA
jgi:hypothetical protein